MVAVVAGNGLGLFNSSLNTLGGGGVLGQGGFGQAGGQALVNASNGNLVLQFTDRQLSGLGLDLLHTRTYNTQGTYGDADGDGWRWDGERRVVLNGLLNTAGSSVVRTTGDGHQTLYAWNGSAYQSSDGDGAHDTLSWDAGSSEWVWTDGSRRTTERYDGNTGRLVQVSDAYGTQISYSYDANGRLSSVKDASGQELVLVYNTAGQLERLDTRQLVGGPLKQQVYYAYDAQGRLSSVTTDLTPSDSSIADGKVYTTTYSYDGASFRIASVSQSDGTAVSFTYALVDGEYRVATATDASGTTTFNYDTANRRTDISNALNQQWSYFYDAEGRLIEARSPAVNGQRLSTRYAYDADGNVSQVTDGRGNNVTYTYDANGNRVLERDSLGNTLARTYSASNQLLNEIRYSQPAAWNSSTGSWDEPPVSSAQVTRYVYDGSNRLRYAVSATGTVSEYRYNGQGLRNQEVGYGDVRYSLSGLQPSDALSEAQLSTWTVARDLSRSSLTELFYDYRGNLARSTRYATVGADGLGVLDSAASVTEYVYSQRSELLQTLAVRGAARTDKTVLSSFAYDGLGRVLVQTDASGTRTYTYDGVGRTVSVTNSAGLTTTQAFDAQGHLLSLSQSGAGLTTRLTQYSYDAAGRLRMVQDATGVRSYTFYDEAGRIRALVDGTGAVVSYGYDSNGQKISETRYATLANTQNWYSAGAVVPQRQADIGLAPNAADRTTTYSYDAAGRLSSSTDAASNVTTYSYDGRGQLVQVQNGDRITRTFYDADGRVVGVLDGEGYLRENLYDAAGRLTQSIRYSLASAAELRASGSLEQLRPAATGALSSWYFYDDAGRQIGSIDEQQFVSEVVYDDAGNRQQSIRYATAYTGAASTDFAVIRSAVNVGAKQTSTTIYDSYGRVSQRIGIDGTVTAYQYDSAGRLVREIRAPGTGEERSSAWRYDVLGQTLGKLTGIGADALVNATDENAVQAAYSLYGLTYAYDAAGRQLSVTDAAGNKVVSYYDAAGRLTHTVNKLGEVTETAYNAFGEAITRTAFYDRLSDTAGLTGGLLTTPFSALTQALRGNKQGYSYDQRGQLASSIDALGYETTYGYNRYGEQTSITRTVAPGKTTTNTLSYNSRGEVIGSLEDAYGLARSTATSYDAFGRVISRTDGRGLISTTRYDNNGRVVVTSNPLNQSQSTEYDAFARVLKQTDALGRITTYSYDDANRTLTQTLPDGVQIVTTRNRHGETLSVKDGRGNTTTYSYDKNGQLLTSTNALSQVTSHTYDNAGRELSVTDAAGNVTRYSYNEVGRTLTVTNALNIVTRYDYDGLGRKIRVTEAEGNAAQRVTEYAYDAKNQLLQVIQDPSGLKLSTTYAYDGLGNQLQVSRGTVAAPQQQVTRYEFDNQGRRTAEIVDPDGLSLTTRYEYNRNGQVKKKIQVLDTTTSYTTTYAYDDAGRLISTTDAAGKVESYTYDAVGNRKTLTNKNGATWTYNYDSRDRLIEEVSPLVTVVTGVDTAGKAITGNYFLVTLLGYDATGNVTSRTQGRLRSALGNNAASDDLSQARTTLYNYDSNNRLVEEISPLTAVSTVDVNGLLVTGNYYAVTQISYDAMGNVASRSEGRLRSVLDNPAIPDDLTQARLTRYSYDKAGRQISVIDAANYVTSYTYDALGNQDSITDAAGNITRSTYDAAGRLLTVTNALNIVTRYDYDALGRKIRLTEAVGAGSQRITEYAYDTGGRLLRITQDPAGLKLTTSYSYDNLGNQVEVSKGSTSAPQQQVTRYEYDSLGRRTAERVDPAGLNLLTRSQYNATGQLVQTTDASGAVTTYSYDALGRLTATTDALNKTESYTYDAAGNRKTLTNKNGATWTYNYDSRNHLVEEITPQIQVTSIDANGVVSSTDYYLVTLLKYDAVGNVSSRTEGRLRKSLSDPASSDNGAQKRVTLYKYDKLNRQIGIISPGWYNKATGAYQFASDGTSNTFQVTTEVTYDEVGNAVRNRVRVNNTGTDSVDYVDSYKIYDSVGQLIYEVDALNGVTAYRYDKVGNQITVMRFANGLTGTPPARGYYLASDSMAATLVPDAASDRTLTNTYDKAGRKISVQQDKVKVFIFTGDVATSAPVTVAPTTLYTYDALGRVVTESQVGRNADGTTQITGASTTYYYDNAGNRVGMVNAMGYYTRMEYDNQGRLTRQVEYSTALTSWAWDAPLTAPASSDNDRSTLYSYDALGRLIQTTRENVLYGVQDATDLGGKVTVSTVRGNLIESRSSYDGVGNITQTTDALGNTTKTQYNALGQVTVITEPARWTAKAGAVNPMATDFSGLILASPITSYLLNAYGQIVQETRQAGTDQRGLTQVTRTVYDTSGYEVKSIDAANAVETYKVDVAGRRIEELQKVSVTLNAWTVNGSKVQYNQDIKRTFKYDKLGQQTDSITWYSTFQGNSSTTASAEYNRFGEVIATRQDSKLREVYSYDQRGKAYEYFSTEQNKVELYYDLAGNVTKNTVVGDGATTADDRITYTVYDVLGRATQQYLPSFNANISSDTLNNITLTSTTPVITQNFDRWGNVSDRIDVFGRKSYYNYDYKNRMAGETLPATEILRENGTVLNALTLSTRVFDAQGNQIAEQDYLWPYAGQSNWTLLRTRHHVYNQVGELARDVDALGNTRAYLNDAHGNRVATRDAANIVTLDTYDAMNRQLTHGILRNNASVILQTNRYDQAGRLVAEIAGTTEIEETLRRVGDQRHGESYSSGVAGNTRYTLYDERGNVTWTRNESKVERTYRYDAYGRKTYDGDTAGALIWTYSTGDYSRLISHQDLGYRVYNYTYNAFGQLAKETLTGGPDRVYTYYKNGLSKDVTDGDSSNWRKTTYVYDQAGNKVREVNAGLYTKDTVVTNSSAETRYRYDAKGRLLEVKTPAGSQHVGDGSVVSTTAAINSLKYSYDEFGNRRRVQLNTTNQVGVNTVIDDWYKYDLEGRALISEGYLSDTGKVVAGAVNGKVKGQANTYDAAGKRMSSESFYGVIDFFGTPIHSYNKEIYSYTDLGQLSLINRSTTNREVTAGGKSDTNTNTSVFTVWTDPVNIFSATFDDRGNRVWQADVRINRDTAKVEDWTRTFYSYRGDGKMASQQAQRWTDGNWKPTQYSYFNETAVINPDGVESEIVPMISSAGMQNHSRYVIYDKNGDVVVGGAYYYSYAGFDSWKESEIHAVFPPAQQAKAGLTVKSYSARGDLLSAVATGKTNFTLRYASDRTGKMTARRENDGTTQSYITLDNRALANIGNADTPEITDTIDRITPTSVGLSPTNYVVVQGDTLQGIAQKIWGDSSMWYLIADANGLGGNDALDAGSSLTIPNVGGSNANNSTTFKPYDESEIIGDTTPTAKFKPPKPKKKKSGGLGSIVMVVVAVVAAVFTAGAALAAMGAVGGSFMSIGATAMTMGGIGGATLGGSALAAGVAAFGAAAAVGSAASQLAGMAMGMQDKFSWSQVAVAGITGGITAGVGSLVSGPASTAITASAGYVGNYAASKVVGLDASFSWSGMAASVVGSTIGSYVGGDAANARTFGAFAKAAVHDQFTALTTAVITDKWLGGARPNYAQVATDAFGNSLGNSIKGQMARAGEDARLDQWTQGELDRAGARAEDARVRAEQEQGQRLADWTVGELSRADARASDRVAVYTDAKNVRAAATAASSYSSPSMGGIFNFEWGGELNPALIGSYEPSANDRPTARQGMHVYWQGVADQAVGDGSFLKYSFAKAMEGLGSIGYDLGDKGQAVWNSPGEGFKGALKSLTTNFGPELFNLGANLVKTSANGWTLLAEEAGLPSDALASFRETEAYNIPLLTPYENAAQEGGALLGGLVMGGGIAKFGHHGLAFESIQARGLGRSQAGSFNPRLTKGDTNFPAELTGRELLVRAALAEKSIITNSASTSETVSVYRKMSAAEAEKTLDTMLLQPPIEGADSSKYLSESLKKVEEFQNNIVQKGVGEEVIEFVLDKQGYGELMKNSVPQLGSKGIKAVKFHYEGLDELANPSIKNIGIPKSMLNEFNRITLDIRRIKSDK